MPSLVFYVAHWLISYNAYGRQTTAMDDGSWTMNNSYERWLMDNEQQLWMTVMDGGRQFMEDGGWGRSIFSRTFCRQQNDGMITISFVNALPGPDGHSPPNLGRMPYRS